MREESKIVAVFSAPLTVYEGKVCSVTDVAIKVGNNYASSKPVEIEVLREIYERILFEYVSKTYHEEFLQKLDKFHQQVIISLKQASGE